MRGDIEESSGRWLRQAEADLLTASRLREMGIHYAACFFAQQAAEKALKGALIASGVEVARTHSVVELARGLAEVQPSAAGIKDEVGFLDQYYTPTRYPDALPGSVPADAYGPADSERAVAAATRAMTLASRPRPG